MTSNIFDTMSKVAVPNQTAARQTKKTDPIKEQTTVNLSDALPSAASKVNNDSNTDVVEISNKQKKGPIKSIKGFIANIKKIGISASEYTKGGAKGIAAGAVAGSIVYTAGSIFNGIKKSGFEKAQTAAKKAGEEFAKTKPAKVPAAILAAGAAAIALGVNIWNASLNATERKSNVDHRWIGHNNNN